MINYIDRFNKLAEEFNESLRQLNQVMAKMGQLTLEMREKAPDDFQSLLDYENAQMIYLCEQAVNPSEAYFANADQNNGDIICYTPKKGE